MKKFFTNILFFAALALALQSSSGGRASAANSGNTGAPGEPQVCGSCHNGNSSYGNISIAVEFIDTVTMMPVAEYNPGWPYTVRMTISNSGAGTPVGYGGQLTILDEGASSIGNWLSASASNTQLGTAGSRTYMEQTNTSSSNVFEAEWRAPQTGADTLYVYAAGNGVNGNNQTSNDAGGRTSIKFPPSAVASSANNVQSSINFTTYRGSDQTRIDLDLEGGKYTINLSDALGRVLWTKSALYPSGNQSFEFLDAEYGAGIYFLQVVGKQEKGTAKLSFK